MTELAKASGRSIIEVADSAEAARLAGSGTVSRDSLEDDLSGGPLILDGLRRRPRYFDGRFLTGADLTRDQDYVRQRQADMARASGAGVISGLQVAVAASVRGQSVRIQAGVGLTPSGDVVMLGKRQDVPILDMPVTRQLDAALGLSAEPRVPLGRRSGMFVLALRAVEFTANPIAAYPRSITGQRTVEDGDIIEATAITLIPYPDHSGAATLSAARRAVAKQIFLGKPAGVSQDALPLALIGLDRGTIRWIDMAMVRRETGADSGVQVAFGGRPRAIAEAHVLQHRTHLNDVLDELRARSMPPVFPAAQAFAALPPAGQLPAAAIQPDNFGFRQFYFPPTVDVDIAFVPVDEIGALVEESLSLPPIDLEATAEEIDATGVLVMVPVTRARFQRFNNALPKTRTPALADPAAAASKPAFDMLSSLIAKRTKRIEAAVRDAAAEAQAQAEALTMQAWHAAWQEAIAALPTTNGRPPLLWYTRRRAIAYDGAALNGVSISGDDVIVAGLVSQTLKRLKLEKRFASINARATALGTARVMALLGGRAVSGSDILTASVIADLEAVIKAIPTQADLPKTDPAPTTTPAPTPSSGESPKPKPAPGETPPIIVQPPVLLRPTLLDASVLTAGPSLSRAMAAAPAVALTKKEAAAAAEATPSLVPAAAALALRAATVNPALAGIAQPASADLAVARSGLNRLALAASTGNLTLAAGNDIVLGDGEVMDVAQDYSDPRLGEGLARLQAQIGESWPNAAQAVWIGESARALLLDSAFRTLAASALPDLATAIGRAVDSKDVRAIDQALTSGVATS
ncbi:hypothetical protein E5A73_12845 [Sphingomonas gei]|uniref:Uncharacterized protein n=1 Tax=Sphingomonas gei TaxID=1395960 RepID=A0A4S1XCR4_9SPHN|nr:hypothetical protein [Sphingomonas gei]TGX53698.1 hypothetical protein E5A73_12845 [Sphingomonas gei]